MGRFDPSSPIDAPMPPGAARAQRPAIGLRHMEILLAVADTLSFSAAAQSLGMSQPAVSQAITRLETAYNAILFERRPGLRLLMTPVGSAVLASARSIVHLFDKQIMDAVAAARGEAGMLAIGIYPGIASGVLRTGLLSFAAQCPAVRLKLVEAAPGELAGQLADGTLDIYFTAFLEEALPAAITRETLWYERLVALVPAHHPLARRASIQWAQIAREHLILRDCAGDLTGYRALAARVGGEPLDCSFHPVSRGTLFEMVALNFGATISFESAVTACPGTAALPISGTKGQIDIEGVWPTLDHNPARHRLVWHIRKAAADSATAR